MGVVITTLGEAVARFFYPWYREKSIPRYLMESEECTPKIFETRKILTIVIRYRTEILPFVSSSADLHVCYLHHTTACVALTTLSGIQMQSVSQTA